MSMLLSGPLLVGEHVVIESVAGESFIICEWNRQVFSIYAG